MRKWMISLFSVLALAFTFIGCGGVQGNSSSASTDVESTQNVSTEVGSETGSDVVVSLYDSKAEIEDTFGPVPENPGN